MFAYILKSAICVAVYYLFYKLLMSRDTFHRFNRWALLGMMWMSLILPLISISSSQEVAIDLGELQMMALSVEDEGAVENTESGVHLWLAYCLLVYIVGIGIFSLKTISNYISLIYVLHSGERKRLSDYGIAGLDHIRLIVRQDTMSPFSWMHYIVISEQDLNSNGKAVIAHEMGHIRRRHTLDLIFTEICLIFQWFNPAVWLMRRELQTIHEYQADESALDEGINAHEYQLLLIEKATGTRLQSITCSLHQSSIKKRITMMLKKKSNPWARAKVLFTIPVAITGIALLSTPAASAITSEISGCKVSEIFGNDQILGEENLNQSQIPGNRIQLHSFGNGRYVFLKQKNGSVPEGSKAMTEEELKSEYLQNNHLDLYVPENTEQEAVDNAKSQLRKLGITKVSYTASALTKMQDKSDSTDEGNQIFTVCEVRPEFPNGDSGLMEYLKVNLKYPEESAEKGLQGRSVISFVVEKDGSISNIEVMKSAGDDLLDAEAMRVIGAMPAWTPGKQRGQVVRVKYVLPITFRLNSPTPEEMARQKAETLKMALTSGKLILVDGVPITNAQRASLKPEDVRAVGHVREENGLAIYRDKYKDEYPQVNNGVVRIILKK